MNRRRFITSSAAFATLAAIPACKKSGGSAGSGNTLKIFTWSDYLKAEVQKKFEEKYGCKVIIDTFDSNEAMLAKLEAGASGYDLLIPSSYAVQELKRKGLIQPLDQAKIPNLANVDKDYLAKALDPKMEVSVPYMNACTCLSFLASKVSNPTNSWAMLDRPDLKGRITLLDDMREVLGAALKFLGHSINSINPAELAKAADVAIRWKANIAKFESEQYKTGIASGEFFLVQGYVGDLMQVAAENKDMKIFIPKEGSVSSCDDLCIPRDAKNVELAHQFIDFVTGAEIAAENMESIGFRAPNSAAYAHVSEEFKGNEALFPPAELLAKCEPIADLEGNLPLWTKEWDRVKSA